MYLKSLNIEHFRSIQNTNITFNKGINILIGPNNSGKTTIIDALRICFNYKNYHSIHITEEDFYKKNKSTLNREYPDITFDLSFSTEKTREKAIFIELYNPETKTLDLTFIFSYNTKKERIQSKVFGGPTKENPIPDELFDLILNIYLSALRDANRYLTPGRDNILSSFFSKIVSDKDKKEMMNEINNNINNSKISDMINEFTEKYVKTHFKVMIFNDDLINLSMSPIDQNFDTFTKNWKIQLPFNKDNYLELHQNGLGYNNLIYISILLSHLDTISNNEESSYFSLCIEEPEAHLHPQLQNSFFSYLNEINADTNLQIFITSHSPTLTSKADLNSLILVQNNNNKIITKNLADIFSNKEDKDFLKKFLDVTKSQLLFAKKIIFVEGFTEALLIPLFAKIYNFDLDKHGIEVVNMEGLSFKRFIPLFDEDNDLNLKGVILTDDDRNQLDGEPSDSCKTIMKNENKKLKVSLSEKTFEFDLIKTNGFDSIVWNVFKNKHPSIFKEVDDIKSLFNIFNSNQHSIKKTDIALTLSEKLIDCNNPNIIPHYIKEAFDYLKGEKHENKLD